MKDPIQNRENNSRTRLIIVDDHKIIRESLGILLSNIDNFEIVGEASNGQELLSLLEKITADIILMDISMPVMNGIEATAIVNSKKPWIKIIGLSIHSQAVIIKKMLGAGAYGYVTKNSSSSEIISAIEKVRNNQKYLCPEALTSLTNDLTGQEDETMRTPQFSQKELEVIRLIAEGYCNNEIASKLFVSAKTIERHKTNLFRKLNLPNSASLINYAIKNNLLI
ncbi:MAG: response regulator transcription factor [Bacteroidota bacterium]|nr:response regulator transcription factor [Bacteroidota bacterium]